MTNEKNEQDQNRENENRRGQNNGYRSTPPPGRRQRDDIYEYYYQRDPTDPLSRSEYNHSYMANSSRRNGYVNLQREFQDYEPAIRRRTISDRVISSSNADDHPVGQHVETRNVVLPRNELSDGQGVARTDSSSSTFNIHQNYPSSNYRRRGGRYSGRGRWRGNKYNMGHTPIYQDQDMLLPDNQYINCNITEFQVDENNIDEAPICVRVAIQVDNYFIPHNLINHTYLKSVMDRDGWVPLKILHSLREIRNLSINYVDFLHSVAYCKTLQMDSNYTNIRSRIQLIEKDDRYLMENRYTNTDERTPHVSESEGREKTAQNHEATNIVDRYGPYFTEEYGRYTAYFYAYTHPDYSTIIDDVTSQLDNNPPEINQSIAPEWESTHTEMKDAEINSEVIIPDVKPTDIKLNDGSEILTKNDINSEDLEEKMLKIGL